MLAKESFVKVNAPAVVAEVIDGEAVIMNLATGHYFSTQNVGSFIWRGVERGASRPAIVAAVSAHYGIDPDTASAAVGSFLDELIRKDLVIETPDGAVTIDDISGAPERQPFEAPVLNTYTDMEELLLLDPIHDVDQAGWPMPKAPDHS
jgi:hypothetical protein